MPERVYGYFKGERIKMMMIINKTFYILRNVIMSSKVSSFENVHTICYFYIWPGGFDSGNVHVYCK